MRRVSLALIALALIGSDGCSKTPTQPTSTAAQGTIDQFTASLDVLASVPYTFVITQTTNVTVTLVSVIDAAGLVSPAALGLAVGTTPDGTTCTPVTSVRTAPALTAQIRSTLNPGNYCVQVSDPGVLTGTSTVVVRIIQNPPIPPPASTTATETFASNIAAGGLASKTFYASQPGTISVTLSSLTPSSTAGLAVGVPGLDGNGCNLNAMLKTGPGSSPQFTLPVDTAPYCVRIFDAGGLATGANGLASFSITIVHP